MRNFTVFRSDPRTSKTKRWLGLLTFCFGILMGQMSFAQTVTVGTGITTNTNVPTSSCWAYSFSQQIYTAAQIGMPDGGDIMKLRFYYDSSGTTYANWDEWTVYVANTTKTSFTSTTDWEPISNFTQVFSGEISVDPSGGWFDIDFSDTFDYTGGNLIIAVHENAPGYSCTPAYRVTTSDANTSMYVRRDGTDYDLSAISTVTASGRLGVVPQLQLVFPTTVIPNCAIDLFPADIATDVVRNPVLTWADNGGLATNYDVYFGTTPNPDFIANVTSASYTPALLSANTTYYWKVISKNTIGDAVGCAEYSFTTGVGWLYCTPLPNTSGCSGDNIVSVDLGALSDTGQTCTPVYEDRTTSQNAVPALQAAVASSMSVAVGTGGTEYVGVWIDYNKNGVFDDAEFTALGSGNGTIIDGEIDVPIDATVGTTKMRVRSKYNVAFAAGDACAAVGYGTTRDYTVEILPMPTCFTPTALTASNFTHNSAELSWTQVGSVTTWNIEYGLSGFTPTGTPTISNAASNPYPLTGLTAYTNYDYYVRADCGVDDGTSFWAGPFSFKTAYDCTGYTGDITSVTGGSICAEGTTTLQATASGAGDNIFWYDAATGGNLVGQGTSFDTPVLTETTSFWATEVELATQLFTEQGNLSPTTLGSTTNGGITFTLNQTASIVNFEARSTSAAGGAVTYALIDVTNGNSVLMTHEDTLPGGGTSTSPVLYTVELNFNNIPAGTYRLIKQSGAASAYMTGAFPYPLGTVGEVTTGAVSATSTSTLYYHFFNITIEGAELLCESPREEAIATVHEIVDVDITATTTSVIPGNSTTLTASSDNTNYTYTWSWDGGTDTGASITVSPVAHTIYTVTGTDSVTGCMTTSEIEILVFDTTLCNPLAISSSTPGGICEEGITTLQATASGTGSEVYWYDAAVDGNLVGQGSSFETPFLTETTSYWAAEVLLENTPLAGQAFANPTTFTNSTSNAAGLLFEVTSPIKIVDVEVFGTNATGGDITIELRDVNNGNTTIATTTATITGGGTTASPIPHTIPLDFYVPAGSYRLVRTAATPTGVGMGYVTAANSSFPYPLGESGQVTGGATATSTSTLQYFFFNWTIEEPLLLCQSDREEVVATVHEIIGVDITASATSVSPGSSATLTASSANTDYTYAWSWDGGTDTGASIAVSPAAHTTYTVTATDSVTGCMTSSEIEILVFDVTLCNPLEILSSTGASVCQQGTATLQATANGTGDGVYWYDAAVGGNKVGEGASFETPILTETTSYWASEVLLEAGSISGQGKPANTLTTGISTSGSNWGLMIDAYEPFTIVDVTVYSTGAGGDITVELQDETGTPINSVVVTVPGGGTATDPVPYVATLNLEVPAAGTYRLLRTASTPATVNMVRESSGNSYPYPLGTVGQIPSGFITNPGSAAYYWFYNWTVSTSLLLCESDREEVVATVNGAAPSGDAAQELSLGSTLADFDVTATGTITWYADDTLTTTLPDTTEVVDGTIYYVTQTIDGCESTALAITATVVIPPPVCDISVTISSSGWGDATTWELLDADNTVVLSGGTYGSNFSDTQTTSAVNPPYTLEITIDDFGWCDNSIDYAVNVGGTVDTSGTFSAVCDELATETIAIGSCPTCPAPANLGVANVTATSADLTWDYEATSNYSLEWGVAGFVQGSSDGTLVPGATSPYSISTLTLGTTYEFYVFEDCGNGDISTWAGPYAFTAGALQGGNLPTQSDTSANITVNSTNFCTPEPTLSIEVPTGYQIAGLQVQYSMTATNGAYMSEQRSFIYSPTLSAGEPNMASGSGFNEGTYNYNRTADFANGAIGTVDFVLRAWRTWSTFGEDGCSTYNNYINNGTWVIIPTFELIPPCPPPTNLGIANLTASSVDLTWTGTATAFDVEWGTAGFTPTGTPSTGFSGVTSPQALTGLTALTSYDFYVRQDCDTDGTSDWVGPFNFTTPCEAINTFPFTETFETDSASRDCWSNQFETGTTTWTYMAGAFSPLGAVTSANTGALNATFGMSSYTANVTKFVSPALNLSALTTPEVTFWYANQAWGGDQNELRVYYKTSANGTWELIPGAVYNTNVNEWTEVSLALPSPSSEYFIAFEGTNAYGYGIALDDVVVDSAPLLCDEPTDFASDNLTENSVELTWTGTAGSYDIEYGAPGFTSGTGTTVTGVSSPYILSGLDDETQYDVYIKGVCGSISSDWVGPVTFTTLEIPPPNPCAIEVSFSSTGWGDATSWELIDGSGQAVLSGGTYGNNYSDTQTYLAVNPPYSLRIMITAYCDNNPTYNVTVGGVANISGTITDCSPVDVTIPLVGDLTPCIPACPAPTNLAVTGFTYESADLSWVSSGSLFDIEWGVAGFTPTGTPSTGLSGLTATSQTLTGLTAETHYEFYVRRDCDTDGTSTWAGPYAFYTGYCIPTTTYTYDGYGILGFSTTDGYTNISNENNGLVAGYSNYSNLAVTQSAGSSFNFSITVPGYTLAAIWIDLDQDLIFDPVSELLGTFEVSGTANTVFTGSMPIPPGTPNGDYRIRVRSHDVWNEETPTPCGEMFYGETEDYTLTVVDVPACMPPSGLSATSLTLTTAELSWISTGTLFDIEWGVTGFTPTETPTVSGVANPYLLTTPTPGAYQFYVRQDCGTDGTSLWVGPYTVVVGAYSDGDIPTQHNTAPNVNSTDYCTPEATITIDVPAGMQIAGLQVQYSMTAHNVAYMSEQRSFIYSPTLNVGEASITSGAGTGGTYNYSRSMNFANGATGTVDFALRAWRTWGGSGCNTDFNYVNNNTWVITPTFEPIPPCPTPLGLSADVTGFNEAILSWTSAGTLFDIEYGEVGFTPTGTPSTGLTGVANPYTLSGLTAETDYEYYVRQDCGTDGTSAWAGPYAFYTGYCTPTTTYTYDGYGILGFSTTDGYTNISNENNGLVAGYSNYSNLAVTQSAGSSINFSITVPGSTFAAIWIDLNQDLSFDPVMEILGTFEGNTVYTGSMPIPPGTPNGDYRIRIRSYDAFNGETPTPCGEMFYGETEDYTLTVVDAPTCLPPSGLVATPLSITSAEFAWTSAGNNFDLEWGEQGFTQGTGTMVTGLTASPYQVTDLTEGTTYSFYVRQDCGVDGESLWAGPISVYVGYCQSVPTSNDGMGITNVTVGATSFAVADVMYYDNTATVADIQAGTTVNSTVTFATGWTYNTNIWIDLNDDGVFDNTTELVFQGESTNANPTTLNTSFLLDAAAPVGEHRMRIGTADAGQLIPDPCYSGAWGVTVDLTVNITAVPSCLPPTALTATTTADSATLGWTSTGTLFDIEYGAAGFTPTGTPTVTGVTNPYTLTATPGAYQFYVRQDCGDGDTSFWTGPYTFIIGSYTGGDIPTQYNTAASVTSTDYCTPEATLTIEVPAGYEIASLQVMYAMTAHNGAWMSEQRSFIYSPTLSAGETALAQGTGTTAGTLNYNRALTFANGATGTVDFVLRAWRTWTTFGEEGCSTYNNYVNNGTWVLIPTFVEIPCDAVTPTGGAAQSLTLGDTLADLDVTSDDDLVWYSDEDLTVEIPETTVAVDGTTYYVVSETDICQSDALAITVTVIDPCAGVTAPTGATEQSLLLGQTIAGLTVAGNNLVWYSDEDLTVEIPNTTAAVDGTTYYVVSETDTCQSDALAITVTVIDPCAQITTPTGDAEQTLDEGDTLADLVVNGDNLAWYSDADLTISIPATTVAQDGVTYYVASVTDICQSEGLAITVTIAGADPCQGVTVPAPTGDENQTLNDGQTLADLIVEGENLQWYADEDLTEPLEETHVVENETTYYVTQATEDGCTSEAFAVTVTTLSTTDFETFAFSFYPNPVSEVLQLTSNSEITQIDLFNMLGQKVNAFTNANNTQVDMSGLPTGNYIISVTIEGITKTFKVVKN